MIPKEVSVVIPCYNGAKRIGQTLEFLSKQSYPKYEILVVNDGSTDCTEAILREAAERIPNLKYINQRNKGIAAARDIGVKSAKGEIIAFTDDDREPDRDWIKNGVEYFDDENVVGVQGSIILTNREEGKFFFMRTQRDITTLDWRFATANIFYRKKTDGSNLSGKKV